MMLKISCRNCTRFVEDSLYNSGFEDGMCTSLNRARPKRVNGMIVKGGCSIRDFKARKDLIINIVKCTGCDFATLSPDNHFRCAHSIVAGKRQESMERHCPYHKDTVFTNRVWHQYI